MLFKMGEVLLHTVTVMRFSDGSMSFDRATLDEAEQIVTWFKEGVLSFDIEQKMFVINNTGSTKMLGTAINVAYITWFRKTKQPFFGPRDIGQGKGFSTMHHPLIAVYSYLDDKLVREGPRGCDHKYEDYMANKFANRPNPDADPSIPEELEVEKDEQPVVIEKNWPSFMPNGVYSKELHEANCNELAEMYPWPQVELNIPVMPSLHNPDGTLNEEVLTERRWRMCAVTGSEVVAKERGRLICKALGDFVARIIGVSKQCRDAMASIDEQMQEAHAAVNDYTSASATVEVKLTKDEVAEITAVSRVRATDTRNTFDKIADYYIAMIAASKIGFSHYGSSSGDLSHISWILGQMKTNPYIALPTRQRWINFIHDTVIEMDLTTQDEEEAFFNRVLSGQ